jgi:hypothetical protein
MKTKTTTGFLVLLRLARFKKEVRKLEPLIVPSKYRAAAKLQGINIK